MMLQVINSGSTFSIDDSTFRQIVGRQFNANLITRNNPDEVFSHPTGNVRHHLIASFQLDSKTRVSQRLSDRSFDFECFFFFTQN